MLVGFLVTAFVLFVTTYGAGDPFSYDNQINWPGVCVSNNNGRQSPIDIQTSSVKDNSSLTNLKFMGWTLPVNGVFRNKGHNVQFDPTSTESPAVTTITPFGTYQILQMHMHWGRNDSEGSEHRVNGKQYPLELHFVHTKEGSTDSSAGDRLAVVGVFARAVSASISGVWAQLNVSAILEYPSSINVTNLVYNDLLPPAASRDYYYYVGSLTTPDCDEVVQWLVLKEPIDVPAEYLNYLRQVQSITANEILTFNFREPQALGQRSVYTVGSDAPKVVLSTIVMLISAIATICFS